MTTPVFVEAMPGACIFFCYPEAFTKANVVVERGFVFSAHSIEYFWIFPVNGMVTVLFVGEEAGMAPFLGEECLFVFLRSRNKFSCGHTNIFSFGVAGALVAVYTFFMLLVDFCFIRGAKNIL